MQTRSRSTVFKRIATPALLLSALTLLGCSEPSPPREVSTQSNNLDILFVIDNSSSMAEEQTTLAEGVGEFLDQLGAGGSAPPNLHIGVISTNAGAGQGITGCEDGGDNGILQAGQDCDATSDRFIIDVENEAGTARTRNYSGELSDAVSCMADLGTSGCGFEQTFRSIELALNGSRPENEGFLRPDAALAVIILTDEDDCSASNALFDTDAAQDRIDSELGFLSSFRCFEFGVQCNPDSPRTEGSVSECQSRENSAHMRDVAEYAEFLKGLKSNPRHVVVAGIVGPSAPVAVELNASGEPTLQPSCGDDAGGGQASGRAADPGIRISAFLEAFPDRNAQSSICNVDYSSVLADVADLVASAQASLCLAGDLVLDAEGAPTCDVADVNSETGEESELEACNETGANTPCYRLLLDTTECSLDVSPSQLRVTVERGGGVPTGTHVVARCVIAD